jgi:hypothetical protein
MSDMPPSEFGGKTGKHGIQPLPHRLTSSEILRLGYRTGQDTDRNANSGSEAFNGLLPLDIQTALRREAGDLEKGQVWDEMIQEAEAEG